MNSGTIAGLTSAPLKTKGWNLVQKTVTSSGTVSWKSGLGAITQILGPADTVFKISTPNTSTPSDTTKALTISTGNSLIGTDPQAYAGDLTVQAGGGGNGGILKLYGGSGPYNGGRGTGQAWGGHITLNGNSGWIAGSVFINGGQGGNYNSNGGNITLTSGTVQYINSVPGNISLITSPGGVGLSNGGELTNTTGSGSSNTTANAVGWIGGTYKITTGAGGAGTATTGTTTGGAGGAIILTSGAGGTATSVTTGTKTGGNSGSIALSTGQGGAGTTVNGDSGSITISTGLAGAGAGSAGVSGSILFNTGSTNQITISPARTTITNEAKIERAAVLETSSTFIQLDVTNYAGMVINCTASSAVTITLPTTNVPLGYNVVVIRSGTGTITFVEGTVAVGGAANIIRSYSNFKSIDSYSSASLICLKSGSSGVSAEYSLSGGLLA